MCLIDLGMGWATTRRARWRRSLPRGSRQGFVTDGLVAQSEAQRAEFWTLRETIPLANRRIGAISSHDISVPVAAIPGFIAKAPGGWRRSGTTGSTASGIWATATCITTSSPCRAGARADHAAERPAIKACVHDLVHEMGGSVSAEHGIGRLKVDDLERYGDPAKLAAMRAIKAALDPLGIMNPGAVLRGCPVGGTSPLCGSASARRWKNDPPIGQTM
jgi:FAD/FMN-containing dehydrogenase